MKSGRVLFPIVVVLVALFFNGCQKWEPESGIRGYGPMLTETRQVSNFNGIQTDVDASVTISQSPYTSILITGQQNILDILRVRVINNILIISYDVNVWAHERLEIYITVPELNHISSFGSAEIVNQTPLATDDLSLDIFGSGSITLNGISAESLLSRINGSGSINLQGATLYQRLTINGSGNCNAWGLLSEEAGINVFGSGRANILVTGILSASIHGSGSVCFMGNPQVVHTSVFGSGKIVRVQ